MNSDSEYAGEWMDGWLIEWFLLSFYEALTLWLIQANELLRDYEVGAIEHSGKLIILMDIISQSVALREKILVFRCNVVIIIIIIIITERICLCGIS